MKNIIFDFGGVLLDWNPDFVYKEHFENDPEKMQRFYDETGIKNINIALDRGCPFQETLAQLAEKFPHYHEPILMWRSKWPAMVSGSILGSVKILESLHHQNYPLYALTNFSAEMFFQHMRHQYKFFDYFKDIVVSGVEHLVKPDPKIYKLLLTRNNLKPQDCIYIDDVKANLVPAQNLGISTIEFSSPEQLINNLKLHGVSVTHRYL